MRLAIAAEIIIVGLCCAVIVGLLVIANTSRATPSPRPAVAAIPLAAAHAVEPAAGTSRAVGLSVSMPALAAKGEIAPPIIGGRATWYPAHGNIAAAGPALRQYLGRNWRGDLVSVCHGGRCLVVTVSDWCSCHGGGGRLLDLSDDAFAQLAPLSKGVIPVSITRVVHHVPKPPATDTEP